MLSVDECKKLLNRKGEKFSDGEIEQIRDFLWDLAQIEVNNLEISDTDEDSSNNEQGKQ